MTMSRWYVHPSWEKVPTNQTTQALALYQEWLELDLFQDGLNRFSEADFRAAGLTAADRYLIQFMAEQSLGHVTMISNMLGAKAPQKCNYVYPFRTVREFVDFCQKLTRFGEAGVYGFLPHLNSREAAALMLQTIATGARQQVIFRQFEGLFPMPVWFEVGVPQSWAWSLLAPYIASCPAGQTRLAWQNFPALRIMNQPNPARVNASSGGFNDTLGSGVNALNSSTIKGSASCLNSSMVGNRCNPAITRNRTTPLSYPGRRVYLKWDSPGQSVGPNNSYITSTMGGKATYVVWVSQLNVTYSPLTMTGPNAGITTQPNLETYVGDPAINGTLFIAIADKKVEVTPFNMSMVNPHIVAGPALYQAG